MSAIALFRHAILALQRDGNRLLAQRLRAVGLTPPWAEVIAVLSAQGPCSIRELGKLLVCEADHPSRLISRMQEAGLVTRRDHPDDARAVEICLTAKGSKAARRLQKLEAEWDEQIAAVVSEEEIERVLPTLLKLLERSPANTALQQRYTAPVQKARRSGEL